MIKYSIMRFFLIFALGFNSTVFAADGALDEGLNTPRLVEAIQALYVEANSPDKISKDLKLSIAKTLNKYDGKKTNASINEVVAKKTGIGVHVVQFCRRQASSESRKAARAASEPQPDAISISEDDEAELPTFIPTTLSNFPPTFPQFFKAVYDFSFIQSSGSKKLSENQIGAKLITVDNLPILQKQMKLMYVDSQFVTSTNSRPDLLFYSNQHKRYIIVELKAENCHPRHFGQLSYYISLLTEMQNNTDPVLKKDYTGGSPIGLLLYSSTCTIDPEIVRLSLLGLNPNNLFAISKYNLKKDEIKEEDAAALE